MSLKKLENKSSFFLKEIYQFDFMLKGKIEYWNFQQPILPPNLLQNNKFYIFCSKHLQKCVKNTNVMGFTWYCWLKTKFWIPFHKNYLKNLKNLNLPSKNGKTYLPNKSWSRPFPWDFLISIEPCSNRFIRILAKSRFKPGLAPHIPA